MLLLLAFGLTLVYMGIADRVRRHIDMLILQGVLLFGMAIVQLHQIDVLNLVIILLETLVVKAVVLPLFLLRVKKNSKETADSVRMNWGLRAILLRALKDSNKPTITPNNTEIKRAKPSRKPNGNHIGTIKLARSPA